MVLKGIDAFKRAVWPFDLDHPLIAVTKYHVKRRFLGHSNKVVVIAIELWNRLILVLPLIWITLSRENSENKITKIPRIPE